MNYETMTDLELEAAVHTRVMGKEAETVWIARDDDDKPDGLSGAYVFTSDRLDTAFYTKEQIEAWIAEHPNICGKKIRLGKWEQYPDYTTDPSAWWSVVEKMRLKPREGHCDVSVSRTAALNPEYVYTCTICERIYEPGGWANPDLYTVHANAPTPGRAVCIAALKALEQSGGKPA